MNPTTIEVKIDHGRIIPEGDATLPEVGRGILTLLPGKDPAAPRSSIDEFLAIWTGAFVAPGPEEIAADPRLAYLMQKHVK